MHPATHLTLAPSTPLFHPFQVRNPKKLQSIKQMLNVYMQQEEDLLLNGGEARTLHC